MNFIRYFFQVGLFLFTLTAEAQNEATITIDASKKKAPVSPDLHGIFFEEISHGGEGGLYAELIQNRGFEEANIPPGMKLKNGFILPPNTPGFTLPNHEVSNWKLPWEIQSEYPAWSSKANGSAAFEISRTSLLPLSTASPHSLRVEISKADSKNTVEIVNEGFWGIHVVKEDSYKLNFHFRSSNYKGTITAQLKGDDGKVLATQIISSTSNAGWKKYSTVLKAKASGSKATFVLSLNGTGTIWLDMVSLFPSKTFKNRTNGLRQDLAQYIADLKPAFIRWPGGCFVEGITIESAPDWKYTVGPIEKRVETYSPWGYYTSNGFGYHEYLQYCEDIGAAALYVFNAGVSCEYRSGTFASDDSLQIYIQSALDAIEYAIGPITSKWGKQRAVNGHPKPFPLKYVEVGNEQSGPRYAERYNKFYDAIKAKYPKMIIMASMGIGDVNEYTARQMRHIDYVDEHAYKPAGWAFTHYDHFDKYPRGKWDMYVGEYATNAGVGNGNMEASLSDAVYIMAMEKNSDLVKMSSYAPLLVNVNDVDWPVNLIHFDHAKSFARISYYAIKMFNENKPTHNLATEVKVFQPKIKQPKFTGGIGLATWDTKTTYKNIEVIQDGKIMYKSDFINHGGDWDKLIGQWQTKDSAFSQTAYGAQTFAMLKASSFDTYTLRLKAKKDEGYNAFIIPFAVKDSKTFYRAHIGAWVNKIGVFEKVTKGYEVSNISAAVQLADTIQSGKWYDIELQVGLDTVRCYLNGKLLMSYSEPDKFFAISGKDEASGDIIIKMVNAYSKEMPVHIDLMNSSPRPTTASLVSLSTPQLTDENSFQQPSRFVPITSDVKLDSQNSSIRIKPYSINVLRIKSAK
ncbi:MAG TPA: alpha-L-arabinofuranosidase C-terminal domain-containing protein [Niabella sp.]|nr:alpha-L-arabinofuranosidase C-terminal domain-containing protein [Niabella sp.]HQW14099.1 alpha-L-arabinofuranosidase C-terminal domain-containing protein [Niabella sp.]HQX19358.1 alpha-L-arabinofuranosidase C-terminal domain-containing protein [Niabella sp.]HQX41784.1 alpha-L-arabinofuranosidase C-terminal domain-containing protein [Niabella sp.]HRB05575.1 alpha-L-arabinofuranosidase C-terminal domain-containing protein [Niabella sp.]